MCYNCGCGIPNDPMGKKKVRQGGFSLTEDDLKEMAEGWEMGLEETKDNIYQTLRGQLGNK